MFMYLKILKRKCKKKKKKEKLLFRNDGPPFVLSSKDFFQKIHFVYDPWEIKIKIDAVMEV